MKKHIIVRLSIIFLIFSAVIVTGVNIMLLGTTSSTFFPASNFFVVAFFWLYRCFDSFPMLVISLILYLILIICFVRNMLGKQTRALVSGIYILDLIGVIYLLAATQGVEYSLSLVMDVYVLLFYPTILRNTV